MNAHFSWRKTKANDLVECLRLHPAKNGAELAGASAAQKAWQELLRMDHATRSAVVEKKLKEKVEIVGFGLAAFVKKSFYDAEVASPSPGLNARIIQSVVQGKPVVATFEEVREANTRGDLRQVVLDTSWKRESLDPEQVDEVRVVLGRAYMELFAGYRFSGILSELVDAIDFWHIRGHSTFQISDRFEAYRAAHPESPWNADRALAKVTLEDIRNDPGTVAAGLFYHRDEPQFGFARGEQALLEAALEGVDDGQAAKALFVSVAAIKRRWANIFDRVAAVRPDLCPPGGVGTRGVQKRQRVLGYVRSHPEELRPFKSEKQEGRRSPIRE
jgi:hypothetical protein